MNASSADSGQRQFVVELLGFPDGEQSLLASTFRLTDRRLFSYAQDEAGRTDLYLVNADNAAALAELRGRGPNLYCPAVLVGGAEDGQPWPVVERPIHWSRLFDTLDRVMQIAVERRASRRTPPADQNARRRRTDQRASAVAAPVMSVLKREPVLVVDDSATVRAFMRSRLAPFRFDVDYAANGESAIRMAHAKAYACIFLDVLMPGIDGYEVCQRIKSDPKTQSTAVVMLSSKSSTLDKFRGNWSGCDAYLGKPVEEDELLATIARFLPSARRVVTAMLGSEQP
ncbi:PleD family two-component system response regulator [Lacisediminimonas sp.]|uniref:response regulator n=1 Tax=Lacisediminimonas sp. TaxID=3060582 RepID=UPI002722FBEE|nr:response regulator [Lacisediminimonas sp.]MDO8299580.1 response regulator [Lacisediminimonas sp.]